MLGIAIHKGGTDVVSTRPEALFNYLSRYRREHPLADETMRLTVVGFRPGRAVRQSQRSILFVGVALVAFAILVVVGTLVVAIAGSLVVGWLFAGVGWKIARSGSAAPPDGPVAVMLSDRRFTVLQSVPGEDPAVALDGPPSVVTWGALEQVESRWLFRQTSSRVLLGGPDGVVCTVEMPQTDPIALQAVLEEAGLASSDTVLGRTPRP